MSRSQVNELLFRTAVRPRLLGHQVSAVPPSSTRRPPATTPPTTAAAATAVTATEAETAQDLLHGLAGLATEVNVEEAVDDGVDGVVDEVELGEDLGGGQRPEALGLLEVLDHRPDHHDGQGGQEAEDERHGDGEEDDGGAAHVQVAGRVLSEAGQPPALGGRGGGGGGGRGLGHGGGGGVGGGQRGGGGGKGVELGHGAVAGWGDGHHLVLAHAGQVPVV